MSSNSKRLSSILLVSLLAQGITAAPTVAKNRHTGSKLRREDVLKRQSPNPLAEVCGACPAIEKLTAYIPQEIQNQAKDINDGLKNLLNTLSPETLSSLLNGLPANALEPITNPSLVPNLPGGLPSNILPGLPLPTNLPLSNLPNEVAALPSQLVDPLGGVIPSALPSEILNQLPSGLPTNVLGNILPSALVCGLQLHARNMP